MIRLRVSDLDSWVTFIEPPPWFEISTEQFIAQMKRQVPPTPEMEAGRALHSLLEHAEPGETWDSLEGGVQDGHRFRFDVDAELELPIEREPEVMERVFDTSAGPVLLRGRIDGRDRIGRVIDYKLTKKFDAERYGRSLQWRSYLLMTGAERFRYVIFEGKVRKEKDGETPVDITDVHDFDEWAYDGMEQEVHRRVSELADFVAAAVPELVVDDG